MDLVPYGSCVLLKQMNISIRILIQIPKTFIFTILITQTKQDFIVEFLTNFDFFTFVIRITFLTIIGKYIHIHNYIYSKVALFIFCLLSYFYYFFWLSSLLHLHLHCIFVFSISTIVLELALNQSFLLS